MAAERMRLSRLRRRGGTSVIPFDARGSYYARLNPIYLGDNLHSRQPRCEAVLATRGNFLFVRKPDSHPLIQEYITGIELPTHAGQSSAAASGSLIDAAGCPTCGCAMETTP
jgi:hypothetical protein